MSFLTKIDQKKLLVIPISVLIISITIVGINWQANTIPLGIDFKGGTAITVQTSRIIPNLETDMEDRFGFSPRVHIVNDFSGNVIEETIEFDRRDLSVEEREEIKSFLTAKGISKDDINIQTMGGSLPERFLSQVIKAIFVAFLVMAFVVFWRFKTFIPSLAVVLSAFSDIVTTLAIMILLDIQVTLGSVVALLLLIGYSVDTDIMLATRLLIRKEGSVAERIDNALITGLTMSGTTIIAMSVLLAISTSGILDQIATVIIIGLIVDLMNTWLQNAGILRWYVESESRAHR
ncbi:MAG: protein translocase subunit SecF [Candidatus Hydrothermarchaeales archaeon]